MACNNPLFRLPVKRVEEVPYYWRKAVRNGGLILGREGYEHLLNYRLFKQDDFQQIPCGQCSACRLEYSRQWAIRCMLESKYHKFNYFVTCTYSDENLPQKLILDTHTGEILQNSKGYIHALDDSDSTNFLKRLRITFERYGLRSEESDLRYFYCGEYGEKFFRPHFHYLFFGLEIPDLVVSHQRNGNVFYTSKLLDKIWGKGFVVIGELCFDTCAYVARYVMKKQKGKGAKEQRERLKTITFNGVTKEIDVSKGLSLEEFRDEFCRMSRRPGIARKYFDEHKGDMYHTDELFVKTSQGLSKVKPCRYFDKLYDVECPEDLLSIKERRRDVGKANALSRREKTSLSDEDYLKLKDDLKNKQILKLKRDVD